MSLTKSEYVRERGRRFTGEAPADFLRRANVNQSRFYFRLVQMEYFVIVLESLNSLSANLCTCPFHAHTFPKRVIGAWCSTNQNDGHSHRYELSPSMVEAL